MHLLILEDGGYVQACQLRVGDRLLTSQNKSSEVLEIDMVTDVAMSPIVLDGTIVMPNSTIVSCWSGDKTNADKMDQLMDVIRMHRDRYTLEDLTGIIEKFYIAFLENNKDMTKVRAILKSLNIPIRCK